MFKASSFFTSSFAAAGALALGIACSTAETPSDNNASVAGAAHAATVAEGLCVSSFKRQRDCTDSFLPALVDLRVRLDKPEGIADTARKEGRDALIAEAREEWKEDSTDESIAKTCGRMMSQGAATAQMIDATKECLAAPGCGEFVPCQVKIIEQHLTAR